METLHLRKSAFTAHRFRSRDMVRRLLPLLSLEHRQAEMGRQD